MRILGRIAPPTIRMTPSEAFLVIRSSDTELISLINTTKVSTAREIRNGGIMAWHRSLSIFGMTGRD
jgi:hypothetical protein